MTERADKRRRNSRPSRYRPRTQAQKDRRQALWLARTEERQQRKALSDEARLLGRLDELENALRDAGRGGVHGRRNSRPLDEITDDAERLAVLKARVERLEAFWTIDRRKRETRGKIIIGGALLAELADAAAAGDPALYALVLDLLDRRVDMVRDRLTVRELLGGAPLPLRPGASPEQGAEGAQGPHLPEAPDFDAMAESAMAKEALFRPSQIDGDYADLDAVWTSHGGYPSDHFDRRIVLTSLDPVEEA